MSKQHPAKSAPIKGLTFEGDNVSLNANELKRPDEVFAADWAEVRMSGAVVEVLFGQSHAFSKDLSDVIILMMSRESYLRSFFTTVATVLKAMDTMKTTPMRSDATGGQATRSRRIAADWVALATANDFSELVVYRVSQHGIHLLTTRGPSSLTRVEALVTPVVTVVAPTALLRFVVEHGRDLVNPGHEFPAVG